jgi:hypothetical protein
MLNDELLIDKAKKLFETSTGWGDSNEWTNQDFVCLSEKIQERTGILLSHVTLKRVWGKVKYDSLPNTHTLDTLVQFLGYENWREFKSKNGNGSANGHAHAYVNGAVQTIVPEPQKEVLPPVKEKSRFWKIALIVAVPVAIIIAVFYLTRPKIVIRDADYKFSSKKVVTEGVPNSVIFSYDATKSPYDSVVIQQSWDKTLQKKVSKNQHQYTSIYYYPDFYNAKLIVGGKIVQKHKLLIKSNGWLPIVAQSPVPIYFDKKDAMVDGKLSLSVEKLQSRNVKMQPTQPYVLYSNVQDFGDIYSDNFVFETSVRDDYKEGAAVCQFTKLYILCEGTAIFVPLSAKGCVSDLDLLFTDFYTSGKKEDLSAFGVDFSSFIKVRVEAKNGIGKIFLDDKLVYTVTHDIAKSRIIGMDFSFQGTGSIDYVKLSNGKVNYVDNF